LAPVEDYLRIQGRFRHLFDTEGAVAQPGVVTALQSMADRTIARYGLLAGAEAAPHRAAGTEAAS
jgi:hypothetical protein